ncbi:MAG TPA: hypothetical protein VN651_19625 [Gemmatimonadaceae bacterium]|nr:hypothetical protein [Gemmatimonadaceae bacterium]
MNNDGRDDDSRHASHDAQDESREIERDAQRAADGEAPDEEIERDRLEPKANPPRTTKGWFTAPKFGSASSGGGEIEPGPEKD